MSALTGDLYAQSSVVKQLYLSGPSQSLDRIDPVASSAVTTLFTPNLSAVAAGIAVVNTVTNSSANPNSATFTVPAVTVGTGFNRMMLVGISQTNRTVLSVNYGGTALQLVGQETGNSNARLHIYALLNPPVGAANVVVTLNDNPGDGIVVGVSNFTGVNQTTPFGVFASNSGLSGSSSVTVSSATGELVYDLATLRASTMSVNSGQTELYNLSPDISGGASTKIGAASVTMGRSISGSFPRQNAIGAVSIKPAAVFTNTTFTQAPALCSALTIVAGSISVTNYVSIKAGTMPASPNITALLKYGANNIITLNNPVYSGGMLTWTGTLGANVTVPAGQAIQLVITTAQAGVIFVIDYDSQAKPSKINLPVSTYIDITSYAVYDAPFPEEI